MAMVRPLATNPAQKLFFLSFTSAEGKGVPFPFWGPSQSFGFSLFPLPVSGDLRLLGANTWSPLCDPHSFLNGHFFWRLDTVNSNMSSSNFISFLPVGYHVTVLYIFTPTFAFSEIIFQTILPSIPFAPKTIDKIWLSILNLSSQPTPKLHSSFSFLIFLSFNLYSILMSFDPIWSDLDFLF